MQTVLLVIYLMVVLALIGVVLIQRSEGGGLGIGGGSGFMSARGTANALTRTTAILAAPVLRAGTRHGHPRPLPAERHRRPSIASRARPITATGVLDSLGGGTTPPAGGTPAQNQTQTPAQSGTNTQTPATTTQTPATADTPATTQTPATQTPAATETKPATSGSDVPSGQ